MFFVFYWILYLRKLHRSMKYRAIVLWILPCKNSDVLDNFITTTHIQTYFINCLTHDIRKSFNIETSNSSIKYWTCYIVSGLEQNRSSRVHLDSKRRKMDFVYKALLILSFSSISSVLCNVNGTWISSIAKESSRYFNILY